MTIFPLKNKKKQQQQNILSKNRTNKKPDKLKTPHKVNISVVAITEKYPTHRPYYPGRRIRITDRGHCRGVDHTLCNQNGVMIAKLPFKCSYTIRFFRLPDKLEYCEKSKKVSLLFSTVCGK